MTTTHTLNEYKEVSADVWSIFKKYYSDDADCSGIADDIHKLDEKYKPYLRQYCFMQKLIKVYFDELYELKGVKK